MSVNHCYLIYASFTMHAFQGDSLGVFFRVLLVGFGLFGPGAARAPKSDPLTANIANIKVLQVDYIAYNSVQCL